MECISKIESLKKKNQSQREKHSVHEKRFSILADEKKEGTKQIICYYKIIKEIADDIFSFSRSFAFTMFKILNYTPEVPTHFADLSLADLFCPSAFPTLSWCLLSPCTYHPPSLSLRLSMCLGRLEGCLLFVVPSVPTCQGFNLLLV